MAAPPERECRKMENVTLRFTKVRNACQIFRGKFVSAKIAAEIGQMSHRFHKRDKKQHEKYDK